MNKENYFCRVSDHLCSAGFTPGMTRRAAENSLRWAPAIAGAAFALFGAYSASQVPMLMADSNIEEVNRDFDKMRELTPLVFHRFLLGSLISVAVMDGDSLSDDQIIEVARTFDHALTKAKRCVPLRTGSVTGYLAFAFWDSYRHDHFKLSLHSKCSIGHFWKKVYLEPVAVSIPTQKVATRPLCRLITPFTNRKARKMFLPDAIVALDSVPASPSTP